MPELRGNPLSGLEYYSNLVGNIRLITGRDALGPHPMRSVNQLQPHLNDHL
jgi:hypothetical protein